MRTNYGYFVFLFFVYLKAHLLRARSQLIDSAGLMKIVAIVMSKRSKVDEEVKWEMGFDRTGEEDDIVQERRSLRDRGDCGDDDEGDNDVGDWFGAELSAK